MLADTLNLHRDTGLSGSLFHTLLALLLGRFTELVTLTSHSRLISRDLGSSDNESVNGDGHTVGDLNDIADVELPGMHGLGLLSIADNVHLKKE